MVGSEKNEINELILVAKEKVLVEETPEMDSDTGSVSTRTFDLEQGMDTIKITPSPLAGDRDMDPGERRRNLFGTLKKAALALFERPMPNFEETMLRKLDVGELLY